MTCKIQYATFIDIYGSDRGGALNIISDSVKFNNNFFVNCTSQETGGAVYGTGGTFESFGCSYSRCYVRNHNNKQWGNAIRIEKSKITLNIMTVNQCGIDETKGADSSTTTHDSKILIKNVNFSSNYGNSGASMIACFGSAEGSVGRYLNGIDGHDYDVLESWERPMKFEYCNLIDGYKSRNYMFYVTSILYLVNCILHNPHSDLNPNIKNVVFINCYSDIKYESHTFVPDNNMINLPEIHYDCNTCKIDNAWSMMNYAVIVLILILI